MKTDAHWPQTSETGADSETRETHLGNWRVDDALLAKLVQKALGDLR